MKSIRCARNLSLAMLAWLAAATIFAAEPNTYFEPHSIHRAVMLEESQLASAPDPTPDPVAADGESILPQEAFDEAAEVGNCADCWSNGRVQRGLWYGSVDYLLVRPRFSQAVAEVRRTQTATTGDGATFTGTDQVVQFPFKYNSAFRVALGYRLLDCGGDIQLQYWRLTGNAQVADGPVTGNGNSILGNLGNDPGTNQFYTARTGVTANVFDIDFAKCMSMGGPSNPCDACFCPRWDLRWSAGARIADVSRFNDNVVKDASSNVISFADINARFVGAGPRVGLQGRRYFGHTGLLSVYARANQSLLIGDYRMSRVRSTPGGELGATTVIAQQFDNYSRMVPVTDIELGGTWQVAPYTFISAGYFFQCWWDLGQAENISSSSFGPLDSANILSFDGLFVRGEMLF